MPGGTPAGRHIEWFRLKQPIGLLPEPHLTGIAVEPAVADNAVAARRLPGEDRGLGRTGDCRHDVAETPEPTLLDQGLQTLGVRQPAGV